MIRITQSLDEILSSLSRLDVDWKDDVATSVLERIAKLPEKECYTTDDLADILDPSSSGSFEEGLLICRLFLGLSKDQFEQELSEALGDQGSGINRYRSDKTAYLDALASLGVLEAMADIVNRDLHWSDILVERLRSGRGRAISGQRRGRSVEDFTERTVQKIFGNNYQARCTFTGRGRTAKCDFAIPSRERPRIVIEAKGYGATGSKMSDVLGDIEKIIAARRADTVFLFVTDGLTWKRRISDLKKIVEYQNQGDIFRIYTLANAEDFESDLMALKVECGL